MKKDTRKAFIALMAMLEKNGSLTFADIQFIKKEYLN